MTTETIALAYGHRAKTTETALKLALERGEIGHAQDTDSIWIKRYDDTYKKITASSLLDLSSVSASQVLATDASKNLISLATVGSGRVVLETSPVLTTPNIGVAGGTSLTLSTRLVVNLLAGNQVALNSAGSNIGFITNPSADTWGLGYGATLGTLGTSALTWNASGLVSIPGSLSATGDFTVSRAASGGTVQVKITNADSGNPASDTRLLIQTGGMTAGDAYTQYSINGVSSSWFNGAQSLGGGGSIYNIGYGTSLGGSGVALTVDTSLKVSIQNAFSVTGASTFINAVSMSSTLGVTGLLTASGGLTVASSNFILVPSSTGLTQMIFGSAGSNYGTIQNDAADTWSLGYKTTATNTIGNSVLKWNASGKVSLSSATASTAAAFDASKNLISVANTGTGSNVLSNAPAFTGTINASGALNLTGADLTISRSNVGGGVTLNLTNNDNTNGNSWVGPQINAGGANGGDAIVYFGINGGLQSWIIGIDNSVTGDPFKIANSNALGTNDALTINSSLLASFGGSVSLDGGTGTFFRPPRSTSNPTPTGQGCLYENTADGHLYRYNGSAWAVII